MMDKGNKQLIGKTALITGGGTGIGYAIAERFHNEGAHVVISGRRLEVLNESASKISASGERITAIQADVTNEEDNIRLATESEHINGSLDVLVNNAGVMRFGRVEETAPEEWNLMMNTNVWGPWRLMVHCLPFMKMNGGGSIINISSIAGIKAFPGAGAYCASKAALQSISQVFAMENAKDNIRVNCILPALVEDTELAEPIFGAENVEEFWSRLRSLHPLGRNGKPADIADAALFFASAQSSWITGTLLNVDGGRHMATNRGEE